MKEKKQMDIFKVDIQKNVGKISNESNIEVEETFLVNIYF